MSEYDSDIENILEVKGNIEKAEANDLLIAMDSINRINRELYWLDPIDDLYELLEEEIEKIYEENKEEEEYKRDEIVKREIYNMVYNLSKDINNRVYELIKKGKKYEYIKEKNWVR